MNKCTEHGCPMIQVAANVKPRCLVEWILERGLNQSVVDVIPRQDMYGELVLGSQLVLPVESLWSSPDNEDYVFPLWECHDVQICLKALSCLKLIDAAYIPNQEQGSILLKFEILDTNTNVLAEARLEELVNQLWEDEIRHHEP